MIFLYKIYRYKIITFLNFLFNLFLENFIKKYFFLIKKIEILSAIPLFSKMLIAYMQNNIREILYKKLFRT